MASPWSACADDRQGVLRLAARATPTPTKLAGVEASYLFDIAGEGRWLVEIHDGKVTVTEDPSDGADVEFSLSGETF